MVGQISGVWKIGTFNSSLSLSLWHVQKGHGRFFFFDLYFKHLGSIIASEIILRAVLFLRAMYQEYLYMCSLAGM